MTALAENIPIIDSASFRFDQNEANKIIYYYKDGLFSRFKKVVIPPKKTQPSEVPIWEKVLLPLEEAAKYSGIGIHKLRELTNDPKCDFVLMNGVKRMIKRKKFDEYINRVTVI